MKTLVTPFKVGLVVIASAVTFVWMVGQVSEGLDRDEAGYAVYALFDDVGGLAEKSRVTIAGINVGRIEKIELDGHRARVWLNVRVPLRTDARIRKKQASLLGEYFLQLTPGYVGKPLRDGDPIAHVDYDTPPSALMNDLKDVSKNVVDITASLKRVISDQGGEQRLINILENFDRVASDIKRAVSANSSKFDVVVDNVVAISEEARLFTSEFRGDARRILGDAQAIVGNVRSIVGENTETVQEGFDGIKGAVTRLQSALTKLDKTLDSTQSIARKIDDGQGTLGQLVNDDRLVRNVNELVEESGNFVKQFTRLQTVVGMQSNYYTGRGTVRNAFELRLQPKPDKYYSLQLIDDPRGLTRFRETVTNSSSSIEDPIVREQQTLTEDRFRLSLQYAKRYLFATGRIGIIENSGGLGLDVHLLNDALLLTTDLFAFDANVNPRMRVSTQYNFFSHLYVGAGVDEVWNKELRDIFVGFGLQFTDDDLKAIITAAPTPTF
ncbi:MAG: MlaD family protein [Myxococcota bacterium]|nr:MlaD family protein [Myxococcota bacterium]